MWRSYLKKKRRRTNGEKGKRVQKALMMARRRWFNRMHRWLLKSEEQAHGSGPSSPSGQA